MKTETDRRMGLIEIDTLMIDSEPAAVRQMLADCIPLRAEARYERRCIEVLVLHPDFEPVPFREEAPRYDPIARRQADGTLTRIWRKRL